MSSSNISLLPITVALGVVVVGLGLLLVLKPAGADTTTVPSSPSQDQNGSITFSETSWELGDVSMKDGKATHDMTFRNDSSEAVTLTSLSTSCMCTTATLIRPDGSMTGPKGMVGHGVGNPTINETIAPGEAGTLRIVFDPNAHGPSAVGPIRRSVMLETSSSAQKMIELTFSGNVIR